MKMGAKGLDSSLIRFSGLDGTNAMSGERKGLQQLIWHTSPYANCLNCKNHRLVLCLVHLPKYQKLLFSGIFPPNIFVENVQIQLHKAVNF